MEDSLARQLGELHGLVIAASSERQSIFAKLSSIEAAVSKVDVVVANLDHMRADYHERFGRIQIDYGKFFQTISALEQRVAELEKSLDKRLETLEDADLLAKQRLSLGHTVALALWALILSMFGGMMTLIVQWILRVK